MLFIYVYSVILEERLPNRDYNTQGRDAETAPYLVYDDF